MILGKIRNRKEKAIRREKEYIQADYELESKKNAPTKKYEKRYTTKAWNRFSEPMKQILTNRYTVILTDHQTRRERVRKNIRGVNLKNFSKNVKRVDEGQKKFWSKYDKAMSVTFGSNKQSNTEKIFGSGNTKIMGGSEQSNRDKIFGSGKTRIM